MAHALHDDATICSCRQAAARTGSRHGAMELAGLISQVIRSWIARNRQRRALHDLDDRLRDDIGVSRGQATHAGTNHFRLSYARRHLK